MTQAAARTFPHIVTNFGIDYEINIAHFLAPK